jgi:hypothetical protein
VLYCGKRELSGQSRWLFDGSTSNCRGQLKCDGTCAETRFRLLVKRTRLFKFAGASVQSTTGIRSEVCTSAVVMLDTPCSEVV